MLPVNKSWKDSWKQNGPCLFPSIAQQISNGHLVLLQTESLSSFWEDLIVLRRVSTGRHFCYNSKKLVLDLQVLLCHHPSAKVKRCVLIMNCSVLVFALVFKMLLLGFMISKALSMRCPLLLCKNKTYLTHQNFHNFISILPWAPFQSTFPRSRSEVKGVSLLFVLLLSLCFIVPFLGFCSELIS